MNVTFSGVSLRLARSLVPVPVLVAAAGPAAPLALVPTAQAAAVACGGVRATIVGNAKPNAITGTAKRDVIVGRGGNDRIRGLGGNDLICARDGADSILGGDGDDTIWGELDAVRIDAFGRVIKKGDSISGGAGDDTIDLGHDPRPASEGTVVLLDGVSYVNAPAAVVVDFRAAATVPIAAEGNDTVTGFNGGIRISGSSLGDTIKVTNSAGDDRLTGTVGTDTVTFPIPFESGFLAHGYGGQDKLRLLPNSNPAIKSTLRIDQQKKTTIRGLQPFTIEGRITGFSDIILPTRALSIFKSSDDSEVITAHPDYRAMIYGRGGADVMTGSDEPDRLDGGQGFDIVRGRGGNDTCKAAEKRTSC